MPSREEVLDLYANLKSWEDVGNALGVTKAVAWRYAKTDYEPTDPKLRKALGLPTIDNIKQIRNPDGTFGKQDNG